jgi:hypothetical protein
MTGQFSVNLDAPAELRKWPSLNNQRRLDRETYMVAAGPLKECIQEFMGKPEATRHLYEIHTAPQPPLIIGVLSSEHLVELSRLKDFL